jgi:hypothetical protein
MEQNKEITLGVFSQNNTAEGKNRWYDRLTDQDKATYMQVLDTYNKSGGVQKDSLAHALNTIKKMSEELLEAEDQIGFLERSLKFSQKQASDASWVTHRPSGMVDNMPKPKLGDRVRSLPPANEDEWEVVGIGPKLVFLKHQDNIVYYTFSEYARLFKVVK